MKDLWELAVVESKSGGDAVKRSIEHVLILCGSKGVGKTTLINSFLQKDDQVKPTIALEYSFGYMTKGADKDVGHVYELGGGTWLTKLLPSVITSSVISKTALAIMVDLSSPASIWKVLDQLLNSARAACDSAMESLDKSLANQLRAKSNARITEDHPDRQIPGLLRLFPIPLIIIGGKYDLFQALEPEPRKHVCRGLRFFAHTYGATLLFYSHRQDQLLARAGNLLSNFLFDLEFTRSPITEPNKALYIPCGGDSFQQIGAPPASEAQLIRARGSDPVQLWRDALASLFPDKDATDDAGKNAPNPVADPQFAEAAVDNVRKQKDVELERYRRTSERRSRDVVIAGSEMQDIYD